MTPPVLRVRLLLLSMGAVVALSCWQVGLFDLQRLWQGGQGLGELLEELFPLRVQRWPHWLLPLWETLCMSIASTALAVALALPMAFLANRRTAPHVLIRHLARGGLNLLRALPDLLLALLLVAAVGFGQLPGTLALAIHSVGMVGKFMAETMEQADPDPAEALFSTGADRLQVFVHVLLPQCLPSLLDLVFYRWEFNMRSAIVLGAVGAGGIGTELISALRLLDYGQVTALLLVIFLAVALVDQLSSRCRQSLGR
ncbi:MAG: phosphonate ABC transporter, permease protein PhnE [Cyanobacteria bacterium MAG IRC1_bin_28]|nr:phosphonate ABC transporter, permease protein PhnE [Cyanobacteria bacterium MAG IRC1_bin_28]MDE0646729.1 phosphonate ABC transporter, permease protein PhnE [Cyanobacteria bacterium MAG IRC4_bin_6]